MKSEIVKLNQIVEQEANAKKKNHDQIESSIAEIEKKIKTLQDNARIVDEEFSFVDNDVSLETLVENLDNVWSKSEHTLTV